MLLGLGGLHADHLRRAAGPDARARTCSARPSTFAKIFGGGTYSELIWALVIVVVLQLVLTLTRWGIYTVAVGGNRLGAAEAGIRVRLVDHPQLHPVQRLRRPGRRARGDPHRARSAGHRRAPTESMFGGDVGGGDRRHAAGRRRRAPSIGALFGALLLGVLATG